MMTISRPCIDPPSPVSKFFNCIHYAAGPQHYSPRRNETPLNVILFISMSMLAGIYIHIPFCATRCHYCNFATGGYETELARRYTAAVREEIGRADVSSRPAMRRVDAIYFGGGTPTTLTIEQISRLIEACRRGFDVAPDSEITAEANPGSVSQNYLEELRSAGVNRLSFGVQSFDDGELRMIGRTHSAEEAREAVRDRKS